MNDRVLQLKSIIDPSKKIKNPYKILMIVFLILFPIIYIAMFMYAYAYPTSGEALKIIAIIAMLSIFPFMLCLFIIVNRHPRIPSAIGLWTRRHPLIFFGLILPLIFVVTSCISAYYSK